VLVIVPWTAGQGVQSVGLKHDKCPIGVALGVVKNNPLQAVLDERDMGGLFVNQEGVSGTSHSSCIPPDLIKVQISRKRKTKTSP
jgi:hypothetical protein